MKKIIYTIFFLIVSHVYGQYNENVPWMNTVQKKSSDTKITLQELSNSFNHYWKNKDFQKKGSGFKPFKRWENHWSNYLLTDGTIATPDLIWKAWEQKQQMLKSDISDWNSIGPYTTNVKTGQGRVNTFIVDPNNPSTFYVGAPAGGIWKSTDSGINWTPLSDQLPQIGVSGIAIDPNNSEIIYIATGDDDAFDTYSIGVLKSINGGRSWNTTGLNFSSTTSTSNEIYVHPTNSNIIWVATSKGFYKSSNAGASWVKTGSGNVLDFKLKPGDPNIMYYVTANRFYKSTDGGNNFVVVAAGLPVDSSRFAIDVSEAKPDVIYLLSANNDTEGSFQGLYQSTDSGSSFTKTEEEDDIFGSAQSWFDMALTVSQTDANQVFVGVLDVWSSIDGGNNFLKINDWRIPSGASYTHADIHFLRYFNGMIYAGTDGGIYQSMDGGNNFEDLTENLNISQYYRVATAKHSRSKVVGGLQDNGGFGYSNNIWNNYHDGDGMDCAIDPNHQNIYYGFSQFGGSLNVTYDGGASEGGTVTSAPADETDIANGDVGGEWITPMIMNNEGVLYAGYSKLYKLVNREWEAVSQKVFGGDIDQIDIAQTNSDIIYVSETNKLYKSVDGGLSFVKTNFTFPKTISSIDINNQNSNIIYISNSGYDGNIYRSIDGAVNWTDITDNLPNEPKNIVKHQDQSLINDLYVGTSLGVYHINDEMTQWEVYSNNLPNVPITDIEINTEENTITVGTYGRGVWQSPIPVIKADTDISLIKINTNNNIQCGGATPLITVKNNGSSLINQMEINYNIDGVSYQYGYTENISPDEIKEIELPFIDISNIGEHSLQIETVVADDAFVNNNILFALFNTNFSSEGQYINTFGDVNEDNWLVTTEGATTNLWQKGLTNKFNGVFDNSYTTNITGNYPDEVTSYLISPCYDLTKLENPLLKFDMVFDIELDWDVLYMEYTLNNGENWEILGSKNDPNWYNSDFIDPDRPITVGKQWTGQDTEVKEYSYDLAALNNESNIMFRFVFASDWAENGEGASIDNFTIAATRIVLSNDKIAENTFSIFPNPSSSEFNIQRASFGNMQVSVYDVTGKLIFKEKNISDTYYTIKLPKNISKGIYFLKIVEGNMQIAKQLMIK